MSASMSATALPQAVQASLDSVGAEYEVVPCDPDLADTEAFCRTYGYDPSESANAILVASRKPEGHFAVCLALATHRLDVNHVVRQRLGVRKVSFANPEITVATTGMEIGGVTPFGLPGALPLWIDPAVLEVELLIVGAGHRSAKIRISPQAFLRLPGVTVVPGLARPAL